MSQDKTSTFDIDEYLKQLPLRPGVYRMFDANNEVIYVGKAVNLKNRVTSYFRGKSHNTKTHLMVSKVVFIEVTLTHSESEALLLENTLIKRLKPPYNISLRDDKSYPYVYISDQHDYPAMQYVRGGKKRKGRFFGPYTSAGAVRESLNLMQRIFRIRQCEDAFFANRQRPCLQFQMGRCSGPCTSEISQSDYAADLRHATLYLEGKNQQLLDEVSQQMEVAAQQLKFESAAQLRDQLGFLRQVQEQQHVVSKRGNLDVFAAASSQAGLCIHQLMIRSGRVIGSKNFYPKMGLEEEKPAVLTAFLGQYYLSGQYREVPDEVLVSDAQEAQQSIALAIAQRAEHGFKIISSVRGPRAQWLRLAQTNADQALVSYVANKQTQISRFAALQVVLDLQQMPERLECFDISHSSGEATVASCVVFDQGGPKKSDYRTFNIEGITPGDDYAAMSQAITRRYTRLKENQGIMPDLLIVDGGKGQITQALQVLSELQLQDLYVLGVAKGDTRKAGFEHLFNGWTGEEIALPDDSSALHLLQHIRDESHRFAITGHRARRNKKRTQSNLQQIDGVGPKRCRALLSHFGGMQDLTKASIDELAKVKGVSMEMADTIYRSLRGEEG